MLSIKPGLKKILARAHEVRYWPALALSCLSGRKALVGVLFVLCALAFYAFGYTGGQSRYQGFAEEMERVAASIEMDLSGSTWLDKVLLLKQKLETSEQANKRLAVYLAEKEAEIENLNRQLHFYRRVIAPEDLAADQLAVFSLRLKQPLPDGDYPIEVIVRKSMKENVFIRGRLLIHTEGMIGQKNWLHKDSLVEPLPFAFRYFQRLNGLLRLPDGYEPQTVHIVLMVGGREKLKASYSWRELLAQRHAGGDLSRP